jgi:hypothetical protein
MMTMIFGEKLDTNASSKTIQDLFHHTVAV